MAEDRRTWYLRQVNLFESLSEQEIEELAAVFELQSFRAGELIVGPETPPERVHLVKEGGVRLFQRGTDQREITADILGPGQLLGVSAVFGSAEDGLQAEAATDVVVCLARGTDLLRLIVRWPQVVLALIRQLAGQVIATEQQVERIAAADARTRVAAVLYRLARDAGEELPGGERRLRPRLTHASLAHQIGLSRETVTRQLAALEAEGYIRREGRRLVVVDPAGLRAAFGLADES